jgi:hypothetical protein
VVNSSQPQIPINFTAYGDESDPGPYPIPLSAPVEGGAQSTGDRHVLSVDTSNKILYELYSAYPQATQWDAACGAKFDLTSNAMRPDGWTSTDAAGLPVFAGLVRYEEVCVKKQITHAVRFTVVNSQRAYIWPARHYASSSTDPNRPPMGLRFRLKASFDTSGFSEPAKVILAALKKHGMIMADNGSNWYITGAPDDRWDDNALGELKSVTGSNFEAVLTVDSNGDPIYPSGFIADKPGQSFAPKNLLEIAPNPFCLRTSLRFAGLGTAPFRLTVFDNQGRVVQTWQNKNIVGKDLVAWDGTDASGKALEAGVYFVQLRAHGKVFRRQVVLIK